MRKFLWRLAYLIITIGYIFKEALTWKKKRGDKMGRKQGSHLILRYAGRRLGCQRLPKEGFERPTSPEKEVKTRERGRKEVNA